MRIGEWFIFKEHYNVCEEVQNRFAIVVSPYGVIIPQICPNVIRSISQEQEEAGAFIKIKSSSLLKLVTGDIEYGRK